MIQEERESSVRSSMMLFLSNLIPFFVKVLYRVAAYAKKHLEVGREYKDKLPKHTHRAFLMAVEADYFLKELEEKNFDIFDTSFR